MKTKYLLFTGTISFAMAACSGQEPETYTAQLGETCTQTKHCLSGLYCEDGTCRKICQTKDDCLSTQECIHSRCVNKSQDDPIEDEDHTDTPVDNCGNGKLDDNEQCDDGNKQTGDGCAAGCTIEANYTCDGQPSICQCAGGFQDSNSDGTCLKDCDPCGENKQCAYDRDGYATGCICASGYQDNNNDGACLPDCETCPDTQECLYAPDGSASCGCPEGTQDNDGNGTCEPACNATTCGDYQSCNDSRGTAICSCTIYATPDGDGSGMNWEKAANFEQAINSANTKILEGNESCAIWLAAGSYNVTKTYKLDKIQIFGGFRQNALSNSERTGKSEIIGNYNGSIFTAANTSFMLDGLIITGGGSNSQDKTHGALDIKNSNVIINNVLFVENGSEEYTIGGAIYMEGGHLNITNSDFAQNHAKNYGAISFRNIANKTPEMANASAYITNTIFSNNRANNNGGAIYNMGDMVLENVIFIDNFQTTTSSAATHGSNIYNNSLSAAGEVAHLTVNNCQFLASLLNSPSPNESGSCNQNGYGNAIMNTHGIVNVVNSVFSSLISNDKACEGRAGGAIVHQMGAGGKTDPFSSTLSFCLFHNLASWPATSQNTAFIGSDINVHNSLADSQAKLSTRLNFDTSSIVRDFAYQPEVLTAAWSDAVYDKSTNRTTLTANGKIFTPGSLVGKYVLENSLFMVQNVLLPILENGEDYVVIPGNLQLFAIANPTIKNNSLKQFFKGRAVTLLDLHSITEGTAGNVIDKADETVGAQPATDIFGQPRPETGKDMGPVEIGSLN